MLNTPTVTARIEDGTLQVLVRDDGVGGARPDGSGLLGLADRLAVLDGRLRVESPAGGGTLIAADIPLRDRSRRPSSARRANRSFEKRGEAPVGRHATFALDKTGIP